MRKFIVIKTNWNKTFSSKGVPEIRFGKDLVSMLKKHYFPSADTLTECKRLTRLYNSEAKAGGSVNVDVYEEINNKLTLVFPVKSQKEIVYA